MGSMKPSSSSASRYNSSFYSTSSPCRSSTKSDPSFSTDRLQPSTKSSSSLALIKAKTNGSNLNNNNNFSSMVKKFMETKSASNCASRKPQKKGAANDAMKLVIAADFLAEHLKNGTGSKKATPLSALHKKLFKGSSKKEDEKSVVERKALTEVKGNNTRTLAMVLRSERELLNLNKEQEIQISELKLMLEDKNREVDKLKDLCLKQREEIKSLKSAILFPDVMNSQLQELVEKQGSELKQAKQLIPSLQMQVTSLTGQLQCLANDLAEVKADKYSMKGCYDSHSSPRTPRSDQEEAANSLQFDQVFSSGDQTTPGSPDDLFLKDLNPCLTPYYAKTKSSKDFEEYDSTDDEVSFTNNSQISHDHRDFNSCARKLSKSSDCCQCSKTGSSSARDGRRSDDRKMHIWNSDAS